MKEFLKHDLSISQCNKELAELENLLLKNPELKEQKDILPFFAQRPDLSAFLGTYIPDIAQPDRIASEYDVFGDFTCDLAVGDSTSKTYVFVEFEDASPNSLFRKNGKKVTPEWAPRLEHGFSQVIDWFWKISDMEKSDDYDNRFGARRAGIHGLVVVGRDQELQPRERTRLQWRQDHTIVHSKRVSVITFDQLARDLRYRLQRYPDAARTETEL